MSGVIISIINNKGGCSKTTTTCNLAHALSKKSKKILVIDNDTQCNSTSLMIKEGFANSIYHILSQNISIQTCVYLTKYRSVYCIPNDQRTAALEISLAKNLKESLFIYRDKLKKYVKDNYDFILIDNPPNLGIFVAMALYMSDFVIVPNDTGSKFSMEGLLNAVSFIDEIRNTGNPDLKFLRILITKVDKRTNASNTIIEHIKNTFTKEQVFKTIVPVNASFQQAELMDQTLIRFKSNAPGAKAYIDIADELLDILKRNKLNN